jgi:hypothetical protein
MGIRFVPKETRNRLSKWTHIIDIDVHLFHAHLMLDRNIIVLIGRECVKEFKVERAEANHMQKRVSMEHTSADSRPDFTSRRLGHTYVA